MSDATEDFSKLPGRLLLDTCVLNLLQDEGGFIFEGEVPEGVSDEQLDADLRALRWIFQVNERAAFQFLVSPLSFAELANETDFTRCSRRLRWALDVLDVWLVMLEETRDRVREGGSVRHRFKLTPDLQRLEMQLMEIADFRQDPFDRLLLLQYHMGNCDAFLTTDRNTIWKHRSRLSELGIRVLNPAEFWDLLRPWAGLWR